MEYKLIRNIIFFTVTVTCFWCCHAKEESLYQELSPKESGIDFANQLTESEAFNIIDYMYYYNGGGIAAGDVNNDGLLDLYFTANQGKDQLYLNQGNLKFKNITTSAGVGGESGIHKWTTAPTMVDINADGWMDIYVCEIDGYRGLKGRNRLYINQGNLTFREAAYEYGLAISSYAQQAAFLDFDGDEDLDMFLLNHAVHTPQSYKRASNRNIPDSMVGDRLLVNDNGIFTDVTEKSNVYNGGMGYGLSVTIADIDHNHYPDIYVTNDFHENDYLYLNLGDGTFKEVIQEATGEVSTFAMGSDISDLNNDGRPDILVTDMRPDEESTLKASAGVDPYEIYKYKLSYGYHYQYSRNTIQMNQGMLPSKNQIAFSEIGRQLGLDATDWSWSIIGEDMDGNGYKDIFITNGIPSRPNDLDYVNYVSNEVVMENLSDLENIAKMPSGKNNNRAFSNTGNTYTDVSKEWGLDKYGCSQGSIIADLDNDGDFDIVVNNYNEAATVYQNTLQLEEKNKLTAKLIGPTKNPKGLGVKLIVHDKKSTYIKENKITRGWLSSVHQNKILLFLPEGATIDSVEVFWPGGKRQVKYDVILDSNVIFDFVNARDQQKSADSKQGGLFMPTEISDIDFVHQDPPYNDFGLEFLLPKKLTSEGGKVIQGDVNGDGWNDLLFVGGKGQACKLYVQDPLSGGFKSIAEGELSKIANREAVDATFFDGDMDGDLDLYIVHGGGTRYKGESNKDVYLVNDGKGNFIIDAQAFPGEGRNHSVAIPLDYNGDGHIDLFTGVRSVPLQYGIYGQSRLWRNNGEGLFEDVTEEVFDNKGFLGMITDGEWIENRKELILVGEWMPVTSIQFAKDKAKVTTLSSTAGMWNACTKADLNQDGEEDILLGNMGLNSEWKASVQQPLELYVDDYDNNISIDPIIAYYKNGKKWVFPHYDLLSKQLVGIKKVFRTYDDFAQSTFSEVFPPEILSNSRKRKVESLSSAIALHKNGKYKIRPMPFEVQSAPIHAITVADLDEDHYQDIILGGNFYEYQPAIGKLDASYGHLLSYQKEGKFINHSLSDAGFSFEGQVRSTVLLQMPDDQVLLVVSRYNDAPLFYRLNKT